jgi:antirestriction protein
MEEAELEEVLEHIAALMGDNDPEWAIHDYEWTTDIELDEVSEYDNILELNEQCNELDSLEEWEAEEVAAAVEAYGYTFTEALERHQQGCFIFYRGMDMEEVAEEIVDECYDIPEFALRYFDYEAFARDLGFDGYTETKYGVICDN